MYAHSELVYKPAFQAIGVRWVRGDSVKLDEVIRTFHERKHEIGQAAELVRPGKRIGISIHHEQINSGVPAK